MEHICSRGRMKVKVEDERVLGEGLNMVEYFKLRNRLQLFIG